MTEYSEETREMLERRFVRMDKRIDELQKTIHDRATQIWTFIVGSLVALIWFVVIFSIITTARDPVPASAGVAQPSVVYYVYPSAAPVAPPPQP